MARGKLIFGTTSSVASLKFSTLIKRWEDWLQFLIQFDTNMQWDDLDYMIFNRFVNVVTLDSDQYFYAQQEKKEFISWITIIIINTLFYVRTSIMQ